MNMGSFGIIGIKDTINTIGTFSTVHAERPRRGAAGATCGADGPHRGWWDRVVGPAVPPDGGTINERMNE